MVLVKCQNVVYFKLQPTEVEKSSAGSALLDDSVKIKRYQQISTASGRNLIEQRLTHGTGDVALSI